MMNMLAIFGLGTPEIIAILVIVFLLFGAKKLPEFARGLGKSLGEFKKAKSEFEEGNMCSFEIPDLSATAWELEITETALGYILAKIADYTEDYEFADNFFKCNIPVRNYSFANS